MPGNDKYDNDNYVAKLLAEDAKRSALRYAAVGLSALLPKRPMSSAPKPNTRFLTNLVREADNHNAALKKKEELEARIRLREMRAREREDRSERQDGRERKRRRLEDDDGRLSPPDTSFRNRRKHDSDRHDSGKHQYKEQRHIHSPTDNHVPRKDRGNISNGHRKEGVSYATKQRPHSASPERRTKRRHRSRSPSSSARRHTTHEHHQHKSRSQPRKTSLSSTTSDPLSPILSTQRTSSIQPIIRGRGAQASTSNIDNHFLSTYDPALDIHNESASDQEDWDMALEAMRDRAAWKQKQADRLREAGFGDEDIQRWEKTASRRGVERDTDRNANANVRDVKWAQRGEAREWDLGKKGFD